MSFYEYVGNPHVHSTYSDGSALHAEIARAAVDARLNFVIVTDHNVWVDGVEGYYDRVLLLVGEELHDVRRQPQCNHLLAYNAGTELSPAAPQPQKLIDEVNRHGGVCFLAHPFEQGSPLSPDLAAIPWVDWDVSGYAGIELWNTMSEFKALLRSKLAARFYVSHPAQGISGPFRACLRKWDELLARGMRLGAIGAADAHATSYKLGSRNVVVFPYTFLFRCVNTHILTPRPFSGVVEHDRAMVYDALRQGRTWVGYDLLGPTTGFRFWARSGSVLATVGEEVKRTGAIAFEIHTPERADIRLLRNGRVMKRTTGKSLEHTTVEAGVYRVEAYRKYGLGTRGWIFSSPIYVK